MIAVEGFNLFRRDRITRKHGGIAVKDVIKANEVLVDGDNRQLELLWVKAETRAGIVYIGALYHPPKPILYVKELLLDRLERSLDTINRLDPTAKIILGGDFNQLSDNKIIEVTGLMPLVRIHTNEIMCSFRPLVRI